MINRKQPLTPVEAIIIGGLSGSIAKTVIAPFDRVKIHFQVASPALGHHSGTSAGCLNQAGTLWGVFHAVKLVYQKDGIYGLFRGHSLTLLRIFPYSGVNFFMYEQLKAVLRGNNDKKFEEVHVYLRLLAGSAAGMSAVLCTYPLDLLRARLAFKWDPSVTTRNGQSYSSLTKGADNHRFFALYRGLTPTLIGMSIYAGLSFFTFDNLNNLYARRFSSEPPSWSRLFFGFAAGLVAQTVSYPLDVLRRRMQIYEVAPHLKNAEYGMLSIAQQIYSEGGLRNFWRGLSINFIKVAPATGISFWAYGTIRDHYTRCKAARGEYEVSK